MTNKFIKKNLLIKIISLKKNVKKGNFFETTYFLIYSKMFYRKIVIKEKKIKFNILQKY